MVSFSADVTVIVAVPSATPVTTPPATVATPSLSEVQIIFWLDAFSGCISPVKVTLAPVLTVASFGDTVIALTGITSFSVTVTAHCAVLFPSAVVTVIVAFPGFSAFTTPLTTVATSSSLDDQVTFLFVALDGITAAVNVAVVSSTNVTSFGVSLTPVTAVGSVTVCPVSYK